jgi:hypothetical protein
MKLIETIQQQTRDGKELVDFMLVTFPLRSDAVTSASDDGPRVTKPALPPDPTRSAAGGSPLPRQDLMWQVANGLRCSGHLRRLRALTSSSVRLIVTFFEIVGPR